MMDNDYGPGPKGKMFMVRISLTSLIRGLSERRKRRGEIYGDRQTAGETGP